MRTAPACFCGWPQAAFRLGASRRRLAFAAGLLPRHWPQACASATGAAFWRPQLRPSPRLPRPSCARRLRPHLLDARVLRPLAAPCAWRPRQPSRSSSLEARCAAASAAARLATSSWESPPGDWACCRLLGSRCSTLASVARPAAFTFRRWRRCACASFRRQPTSNGHG